MGTLHRTSDLLASLTQLTIVDAALETDDDGLPVSEGEGEPTAMMP